MKINHTKIDANYFRLYNTVCNYKIRGKCPMASHLLAKDAKKCKTVFVSKVTRNYQVQEGSFPFKNIMC